MANCGAVYHIDSKPTVKPNVCDACGGNVVQRKDDQDDVIQTRLEAYDKSTSPLKEYFRKQGRFVEIDGVGATDVVFSRVKNSLV